MKGNVLIIPVLAVFFSLVTCLVFNAVRDDALPSTAAGSTTDLSALQSRLASLETSVERLVVSLQEHRTELERALAMTSGPPVSAAAGGAVSAAPGRNPVVDGRTGKAATGGHPGEGAADPGERLARLLQLEGGEGQLRDYLADVIQGERDARSERRQREQSERRRDFREFSKGPYGRHNFQVNSLGRKLGLNDLQKDVYHDLLSRYGKAREDLYKTEDGKSVFAGPPNPAQIALHMENLREQEKALDAEFEAEFAQSLDPGQLEAFQNLPEHERGLRGGSHQIAFGAADGAHDAFIWSSRSTTGSPLGGITEAIEVRIGPPSGEGESDGSSSDP